MTQFVDTMIKGGAVYNPGYRGIQDGKFAGLIVQFDDPYPVFGDDPRHFVVVDENGRPIMNVRPTYTYSGDESLCFKVAAPKVLKHIIAAKTHTSGGWYTETLKDAKLAIIKKDLHEYKILESFYE